MLRGATRGRRKLLGCSGGVCVLGAIVVLQFLLILWLTNYCSLAGLKAPSFLRKLYYKPDPAHLMKGARSAVESETAASFRAAPMGTGLLSLTAPDPFVTRQHCHLLSDESEMCVYEGPLCVNNREQILLGAPAEEERREALQDDGRTRCLDYRYFERRDMCSYTGPFQRPNLPEDWYARPVHKAQHDAPPLSMPMAGRRYGPDDHASRMDAVPWDLLIAKTDRRTGGLRNLPLAWQRIAGEVDEAAALAKAALLSRSVPPIRSVRWVHASAYVVPMEGGWLDHPWHWATATFPLWDAKVYNSTRGNVPLSSGQPGPLNYSAGSLFFPPMDYVVAQGSYKPLRYELSELIPWAESLYPLLTQQHTRVMLNGNMARSFNASDNDYVCFTRGVVTGIKPRLFTGVSEAHSFKLTAYAAAGVRSPAHGAQPPRTITVLGRFSRGFADMPMILRGLRGTGLPVRVVEDLRFLSWAQQVALMAGTGILLAAHGGALANVMYMPAHAVVIEAFPYITHFTMYQRLAQVAGLTYYRLRGFRPDPVRSATNGSVISDPWASYGESDFMHNCEWPHHASSIDALLQVSCNSKTKITPIAVDEGTFRSVLDMALDDIECRDSVCRFDEVGRSWYQDMHTNITWSPGINRNKESYPREKLEANVVLSRAVAGRVWHPAMFQQAQEDAADSVAATAKQALIAAAEKAVGDSAAASEQAKGRPHAVAASDGSVAAKIKQAADGQLQASQTPKQPTESALRQRPRAPASTSGLPQHNNSASNE